jgi:hypothetical protein
MGRLIATCFVCLLTLVGQSQHVPGAQAEFVVMRTDRVSVPTGESTHLNCSVIGVGDEAQMSCESHTSNSGIPLVYHVALVIGSDKIGYIVSCGGGLVWRIGCRPLTTGQVVKGAVEGGKLHVSTGGKTRTYRIETSAYIGPLGKGSRNGSPAAATPPASGNSEPSVKLAVHTEKSDDSRREVERADQPSTSPNTAKVMISSEPPGGDIYVDDNFMGNTPSLIEIPAGSHAIRVEAQGQKLWSRTVSLTAGSKVTLQATLSP